MRQTLARAAMRALMAWEAYQASDGDDEAYEGLIVEMDNLRDSIADILEARTAELRTQRPLDRPATPGR